MARHPDPIVRQMLSLIEASGLRITKVAENSGVSPATLYAWRSGKSAAVRGPYYRSAKKVFASFGIELDPKVPLRLVRGGRAA